MKEWIIFWKGICHFWWKVPFFCLFWTLCGQILGTFPIRPVSMIPWPLNWIIFWIESAEFFWNWIIFWIESWQKQHWIEYWINHFLAKFKNWIESDRVLDTPTQRRWWQRALPNYQRIAVVRKGLASFTRLVKVRVGNLVLTLSP